MLPFRGSFSASTALRRLTPPSSSFTPQQTRFLQSRCSPACPSKREATHQVRPVAALGSPAPSPGTSRRRSVTEIYFSSPQTFPLATPSPYPILSAPAHPTNHRRLLSTTVPLYHSTQNSSPDTATSHTDPARREKKKRPSTMPSGELPFALSDKRSPVSQRFVFLEETCHGR
jgi:hypothetical protein